MEFPPLKMWLRHPPSTHLKAASVVFGKKYSFKFRSVCYLTDDETQGKYYTKHRQKLFWLRLMSRSCKSCKLCSGWSEKSLLPVFRA